MKPLPAKFQKALELFLRRLTDPHIVAILLVGSAARGELDANSDLDVYIITKAGETRERGNVWLNGVEVEYFINPVKQVESYIDEERHGGAVAMLNEGVVLFEEGDALRKLRVKAKKKRPSPLSSVERELLKYEIDDLKKDVMDTKGVAQLRIAEKLIDACVVAFCKQKRMFKPKEKVLEQKLGVDKRFQALFRAAVRTRSARTCLALATYTEKLLGGPRKKNWKLKGPLDIK